MRLKHFVFLFAFAFVFVLPSFSATTNQQGSDSGSGTLGKPSVRFKEWQIGRSDRNTDSNNDNPTSFITSTQDKCHFTASVGYDGNQGDSVSPIDVSTISWTITGQDPSSLALVTSKKNWSDSHPSKLDPGTSFNVVGTISLPAVVGSRTVYDTNNNPKQVPDYLTSTSCSHPNDDDRSQRVPRHRNNTKLGFTLVFSAKTEDGQDITPARLVLKADEIDQVRQEYVDYNRVIPPRRDSRWQSQDFYDFGHYQIMLNIGLGDKWSQWVAKINELKADNVDTFSTRDLAVTSGYRNPHHNFDHSNSIANLSPHMYGYALDVRGKAKANWGLLDIDGDGRNTGADRTVMVDAAKATGSREPIVYSTKHVHADWAPSNWASRTKTSAPAETYSLPPQGTDAPLVVNDDDDTGDDSVELMACGHSVGTPGSHVSANFGWCGHDDWNCAEEHHLRVCPRNARGERCTESYHGFYFLCKGEHVHKYPSDSTPTQQPPTQQPSTQQPTQQPTRGLCGHTYSASVAASHRQVSCPTQNGEACVYSVYYVCAPHTHVYPSGNDDDDDDDDDDNNRNNGNNANPSTNTPSAPSVPTPPSVVYQPCGVHTTAVGGDHSMQASCSRDPRCISQNFYYCQHESHEYPAVSLRPCGHPTTRRGSHSWVTTCAYYNAGGDRCTNTSGYYRCKPHTHTYPDRSTPTVVCPANSWSNCGGTTSHATTCSAGHSYYTCASQAWHKDRTCTRCSQTYQDCTNSASACQSNHWHTDQAIAPIKCGASSWTSCTTSVSSKTEHRRTCRENHQYWTCGTAVEWHKTRTCSRCGWKYSKCGNSATACQGRRWHID